MNFPSNPALGQPYVLGSFQWEWNGKGWQLNRYGAGNGLSFVQLNLFNYVGAWPAPVMTITFDVT